MSRTVLPENFYREFMALQTQVENLRSGQSNIIYSPADLPKNPPNGVVYNYVGADGLNQRFRYNDDSSSIYKWEFDGGSYFFNQIETTESTSSATYTGLATTGPSLFLPFSGDYYVEIGARCISSSNGSDSWFSYSINSATADDGDGMNVRQPDAVGANSRVHSTKTKRKTFTANTTLLGQYKTNAAGGASWAYRYLKVIPIRIGV